ncbi:MAG: DUF368 domain-containing protein [Ruminococcus sp.]|nr:DUF368 domain-containing protein [Ruminococcus sp.]
MALADSVPGVSGGTIAFLMGFYDLFINSLNDIMGKDSEKRKAGLVFIIKLGIGWVIGMALAVSILATVFESGIYRVSSLFMGFIILAIPVMVYEERESLKGKYINIIWAVVGIAVVVGIAMIGTSGETDVSHMSLGLAAYTFLAGMCAISAMVLPGISGSTILLTFGLYVPVITAVKDVLHFKLSALPICIALGLGILAGVFITLRLIKKALAKFRSQTIYCVIGMMVGSLYAIKQGPTTLKEPKAAMTFETFSIVFFIIGAAIVFAMQAAKMFFERKESN